MKADTFRVIRLSQWHYLTGDGPLWIAIACFALLDCYPSGSNDRENRQLVTGEPVECEK